MSLSKRERSKIKRAKRREFFLNLAFPDWQQKRLNKRFLMRLLAIMGYQKAPEQCKLWRQFCNPKPEPKAV